MHSLHGSLGQIYFRNSGCSHADAGLPMDSRVAKPPKPATRSELSSPTKFNFVGLEHLGYFGAFFIFCSQAAYLTSWRRRGSGSRFGYMCYACCIFRHWLGFPRCFRDGLKDTVTGRRSVAFTMAVCAFLGP